MNTSTVSSFIVVVVLQLPKIPALSDDSDVIGVADFIRVGMLILGLTIAAVSIRHLYMSRTYDETLFVQGYRWRIAALLIAILYVCISAYDRLGDPVTIQFVLALLFLLVCLRSVQIASYLPHPPVQGEERLRDLFHELEGGREQRR